MNENNPRQLVFIEEPENGLYHQYLSDLAIELSKSAGTGFSKQIFVTTHSPFFANALNPNQVWVLEKDSNGFSSIKRAREYDYKQDSICGTWEVLADVVYKGGIKEIKKKKMSYMEINFSLEPFVREWNKHRHGK